MNVKTYAMVSAALFALFAFVHLLRLIFGWHVAINDHAVPMWVSVICLLIGVLLSFGGFYTVYQIRKYLT